MADHEKLYMSKFEGAENTANVYPDPALTTNTDKAGSAGDPMQSEVMQRFMRDRYLEEQEAVKATVAASPQTFSGLYPSVSPPSQVTPKPPSIPAGEDEDAGDQEEAARVAAEEEAARLAAEEAARKAPSTH